MPQHDLEKATNSIHPFEPNDRTKQEATEIFSLHQNLELRRATCALPDPFQGSDDCMN